MKSNLFASLALAFLATLNSQTTAVFAQGSLTPPGAPAPTMKSLDQIEPRTPISSLPFAITNAGSYYLTTNLTGGTGITISSSDVTLDLMGFALIGGTGNGISVIGIRTNVAIRNGTVRGWGNSGIAADLVYNGQHQNLLVSSNGNYGLYGGTFSTISGCSAFRNSYIGISTSIGGLVSACTANFNGNDGINANDGSIVKDCTARGNGDDGIETAAGCTVSGCTAYNNTDDGIITSEANTVSGCTTRFNFGTGIVVLVGSTVSGCTTHVNQVGGISASSGCTIKDCTARNNTGNGIFAAEGSTIKDCTASVNTGDGINVFAGSTVSGSTANENQGDGIEVTSSCRVVDNTCTGNGPDTSDGAGINATSSRNRIDSNNVMGNDRGIDCNPSTTNLIIRNSARGNTINYDLLAGNNSGAIILGGGVGFSSTNPWANFEF